MPEAFAILNEDHRKVERLFQQFEQSNDPDVAIEICNELTVHAIVEEELVYGFMATKLGHGYAQEAREEHHQAKQLITQIENGLRNGDDVSSLVKELEQAVSHHVKEEENELWPKLQEAVPHAVESLGADIVNRKQMLQAQLAEARDAGQPSGAIAYANKPPTNA